MDTKSIENANYILDKKEENISLTIEGNLSERKIFEELSKDKNFRDMIMCLKPWGDQELLVKTIIIEDCNGNVLYERPLSVMYRESL